MRLAAGGPIEACLAPEELFVNGEGAVILTRKTASGHVMASFLADVFCVGVKDVMIRNGSKDEIAGIIEAMQETDALKPVDPAYARKLLRDLAACSRYIGLAPHPDYPAAELLFGTVAADACGETFAFGMDGRPFYVPGPLDTPAVSRQRIEALRRRLGDDGFDVADLDDNAIDDAEEGNEEADAFVEGKVGMRYDPEAGPDPAAWEALDDADRRILVEAYHRRAGSEPDGRELHALLHVVVETQVALGDPPAVGRALARLTADGLDRHEAIHAIGSALMIQAVTQASSGRPMHRPDPSTIAAYVAAVGTLTAASWRAKTRPDDEEDR